MVCLAQPGFSQDTLAPLYLFTNGDGTITPYQSGQMLEVGQAYDITATAADGNEFSSWQPVNVFIFTQTNYDPNGEPILPPTVSIVASVVPTNIYGSVLEFTMQDDVTLTSVGNLNITQAFGWQADFVPVPEPAEATIVGYGFAAMAVARRRPRSIPRRSLLI